jgi:hypothetical protein
MYARRQIDDACFLAARHYQRSHEQAEALRRLRSVDLSMPPIQGAINQFEGVDMALKAAREIKRLDAGLHKRAGEDGVALLRDVLCHGLTIERAAKKRGDGNKAKVSWWGGTFRRCLHHLAEISGFAVSGAYRNLHRQVRRERRRNGAEGA